MSETKNQIKFTSFSRTRLLAALLLIIVVIINYIIFGVDFGRHIPTGSIMTFEGPSYFYTSGLLPIIVSICLILYCILSYFKGSIGNESNYLVLSEKRFIKTLDTKIEREKIVRMYLTNNEVGIKYLWLFLFVPYLIINYYYMMVNFQQPFLVDPINITAITIFISIIFSASSLVLLYAFPQWYLRIYTDTGKYELWFEPSRRKIELIAKTLGIIKGEREELVKIHSLKNLSKRNVLLATTFLGYGIFNVIVYTTTLAIFQTIVCYFLVIIGIYLLSGEFRKLPLPSSEPSKENGIRYILKSKYYQQFYYVKKSKKTDIVYQHMDFEIFWAICVGAMYIFIIFSITQIWMVINSVNFMILIDNAIIMTLIGGTLLCLVGFHILTPYKVLSIQSDNFLINSPFLNNHEREEQSLKGKFHNLREAFMKNFSEPPLRKKFKKRLVFMIIASGLGILVLMWQYFFYFNLFNIFNF